ncbi:L,D-transpeptidase family protein [Spirosoma knui]
MFRSVVLACLCLPSLVRAQTTDDWSRLHRYAETIGVENVCTTPDRTCLTNYFNQIIWGKPNPRLSYQGLAERIDTSRLNRLVGLFVAGGDWCSLLDSLESHDRRYRQLKDYCWRCLVDDYMEDSLTIEQIQASLNTYRWLNRFPAEKRVIVNVPAASLRLVDRQGKTLVSSRVIVGKPGTPTPYFTASLTDVVMYPYWNVPRSIMVKELLPKIKKNPLATLDAMKLQVIDRRGRVVDPVGIDWSVSTGAFPYRLRQSTGCDNALGILKFTINNPYDIYLHDTNHRELFTQSNRWLSHGCIRVEKPVELANALLGYARLSPAYLTSCAKAMTPQTIRLPKAVPVLVIYNLLDIDDEGAVRVYKDVYRQVLAQH